MKDPLIPGGYILVSRKLVESEIWDKPPLYLKVWLYLLTKAQHKQYKGLKRGQLYTSIPEIIKACSWRIGFRVVRPTKDQIFQIIDWLRAPNESNDESNTKATMITTTKATHGLLINIDNYSVYQDASSYESNDVSNDVKATKAAMNPDNINKNVKNGKNVQEIKKDYSLQINHLRERYSSEQLKAIDDYFEMIRHTRVSGSISDSVILKTYQEWDKHPAICVEYAVKVHTNNVQYHSRKENYTLGIIRNTTAEEAANRLRNPQQNNRKTQEQIWQEKMNEQRDREIALNRWIADGNDPYMFDFKTEKGIERS